MKPKILITTFCILISNLIFSQKLVTKTGQVKFLASVPTAVEEVAATNNSVSAVFNTATGEIASLALIKAFKFKVPLMEEHFNENYLESDKYPKATFTGRISGFDISKVTAAKTNYNVEGDFTMHGVTKHLKITADITKVNDKIAVSSVFTIKAEDYNIKIPSLVKQKVASDIKVWVDFNF
jgi:hypothetical protein